jgi:hypothetical protein
LGPSEKDAQMSRVLKMRRLESKLSQRALAIFCVLLILVLGAIARAATGSSTNPMRHACTLSGGSVHVLEVQSTNDEFLFCEYGSSLIDGLTLMTWLNDRIERMALKAYRATSEPSATACADRHGTSALGVDKEGRPYFVCLFPDRSMVELKTLSKGSKSLENTGLNQALGF